MDGCERQVGYNAGEDCEAPTCFVFMCAGCEFVEVLCAAHAMDSPALTHVIDLALEAKEAGGTAGDVRCLISDGELEMIVVTPRRDRRSF